MTLPQLLCLSMFIVIETECHHSDIWTTNPCEVRVTEFESKEKLSEYLKGLSPLAAVSVYEGKKIEYRIKVKTEERKREISETVETGREVLFQ